MSLIEAKEKLSKLETFCKQTFGNRLLPKSSKEPSYSMFICGQDGFSINVVSFSHRIETRVNKNLHYSFRHRLVLPDGCILIILYNTVHAGDASPEIMNQEDWIDHKRMFCYCVPLKLNAPNTRANTSTTPTGNEVDSIGFQFCTNCNICKRKAFDITIKDKDLESLKEGGVICGDINKFGWVVIKGKKVRNYIRVSNALVALEKNIEWPALGTGNMKGNKNRRSLWKYNESKKISKNESWDIITAYFESFKEIIFGENKPIVGAYEFQYQNILRNEGPVDVQTYHADIKEPHQQKSEFYLYF